MSGSSERRPLKILHIDPERNWGGGEVQVLGLLSHLAARGHRNHLFADPTGQLFARSGQLNIERSPFVQRNDLDLRGVPGLRREIARGSYDVVHFHTKRAHVLSLWLPTGRSCPKYVVTRRMDYPEKNNWYVRRLYNRQVDGVVAISNAILEILVGAGIRREKIRMIHSGIDARPFLRLPGRARHGGESCVVGSLGVLEPRKGQSDLLKALALLRSRGLNITGLIGGSGPARAALEKQVCERDLQQAVKFVGFVDNAAEFFAAIDIFVMPSRFEGLGVAALEAMAAGKPVVASRVGGLIESVVDHETGFLVPSGDSGALADAVAALVQQPDLGRRMGERGRRRVLDEFTMEQMARKTKTFTSICWRQTKPDDARRWKTDGTLRIETRLWGKKVLAGARDFRSPAADCRSVRGLNFAIGHSEGRGCASQRLRVARHEPLNVPGSR